jgi:hypothetical protein
MAKNTPPPTPLADIVAANLREIIARDKSTTLVGIGEALHRSRQWVYRRTVPIGPITTADIDELAGVLGVSTDELTRRPA